MAIYTQQFDRSARRTSCLVHAFDVPSVTCVRLSDASVICRVTYFQFAIQSVFVLARQLQRRTWFGQYQTSDVC